VFREFYLTQWFEEEGGSRDTSFTCLLTYLLRSTHAFKSHTILSYHSHHSQDILALIFT